MSALSTPTGATASPVRCAHASLLGQRITWSTKRDREWDRAAKTMVRPPDDVRTGVVFSAGPVGDTAWVIPDEPREGEGHAVCVAIRKTGHVHRPVDARRSAALAHANTLSALRDRRCIPSYVVPSAPMGYGQDRGAADMTCTDLAYLPEQSQVECWTGAS